MEEQTKESRKLRIDKSFEMMEWLLRHRLSLLEAALVLQGIEDGKSLAESIILVYELRIKIGEAQNEKLTSNDFNDPIAY